MRKPFVQTVSLLVENNNKYKVLCQRDAKQNLQVILQDSEFFSFLEGQERDNAFLLAVEETWEVIKDIDLKDRYTAVVSAWLNFRGLSCLGSADFVDKKNTFLVKVLPKIKQ